LHVKSRAWSSLHLRWFVHPGPAMMAW
jgi:hypothetical protein